MNKKERSLANSRSEAQRIYYQRQELKRVKQELQRKDNNWNELKEWCNECLEYHRIAREEGQTTISDTFFEMVLDKIKELEEKVGIEK